MFDFGKTISEVILFLLGASLGSFLAVFCERWIQGFSVALPRRSYCRMCLHRLSWKDLLPLMNSTTITGHCRYCHQEVSRRSFIIELLSGILVLATAKKYFFLQSFLPSASLGHDFGHFFFDFSLGTLFCLALLGISFVDAQTRLIPDELSLGPWILVLVAHGFFSRTTFLEAFLGGLTGFLIFYLLSKLYALMKGQDGLGFGDVKMLGMIGAFLGVSGALTTVLVSSVLGSIYGIFSMMRSKSTLKHSIPFGPFLAIGALVVYFWGTYIDVRYFLYP